jgi:hypothetical protein
VNWQILEGDSEPLSSRSLIIESAKNAITRNPFNASPVRCISNCTKGPYSTGEYGPFVLGARQSGAIRMKALASHVHKERT